jgi:aspartyl-tRNA(Asn)/glutamyl-tRNA(Gln) amidotransferase subunit C
MDGNPILTKSDLKKTAHLARLNLTDEEIDLYLSQISAIFNYLEIIKKIDIQEQGKNLQPINNNDFREDIVSPGLSKADLLSSANTDGNYIIAPQTVHKE